MKNSGWKKFAVIGMIAMLVMALGAVAVFAQDDGETPEAPEIPALPFDRDGFHGGFDRDSFHGGFREGFRDKFHGRGGCGGAKGASDEAMAEALGITVEELQAAREQVATDRIAQAVEDGTLTLDQANTLLAMQALKGYLDKEALLAEVLGVSVEDLEAAREAGTLRDLLADITPADLQANMQTAVEAAVQQAVADNVITQDQADLVLERLQNGLDMRGKFGGHRGFGGHGGPRGFRGVPQDDAESGEAFSPFRSTTAFDA